MLTDFLKLIDYAVSLVKRREEVNRQAYSDFVVPMMVAFEAVHMDYMTRLKAYAETLDAEITPDPNLPALLSRMKRDALGSDHVRTKLRAVTSVTDKSKLGPLLSSMRRYVCYTLSPEGYMFDTVDLTRGDRKKEHDNAPEYMKRFTANGVTFLLWERLRWTIDDPNEKEECLRLVRESCEIVTTDLQKLYAVVIDHHEKLKGSLLTPHGWEK